MATNSEILGTNHGELFFKDNSINSIDILIGKFCELVHPFQKAWMKDQEVCLYKMK